MAHTGREGCELKAVRLPPLRSGGLLLSYRCSNACRHCLYRCSPRMPDLWMSPVEGEAAFAALAREPLAGLHFGGYVSLCELCFEVRRSLRRTGRFPELGPEAFYEA